MSPLEQLSTRLSEIQSRLSGDGDGQPLDDRIAELRRRLRRTANRPVDAEAPPPAAVLCPAAASLKWSLTDTLVSLENLDNEVTLGTSRLIKVAVAVLDRASTVASQLELIPALEELQRHARMVLTLAEESIQQSENDASLIARILQFHEWARAGRSFERKGLLVLARDLLENLEFSTFRLKPKTGCHSELRVARHCLNVARVAGLMSATDVRWRAFRESVVIAAIMIDCGVEADSDFPMARSGSSKPDNNHPLLAELVLRDVVDTQFAVAASAHHERLDGSGFPRGLSESEINAPARLLAVAEHYCRLQFPEASTKPLNPREALLETLVEAENGRLDLELAKQLLNLGLYPVGSFVELSTGEIAEIVANQEATRLPLLASLPVVRLHALDSSRRAVIRNLAQYPDTRIVRMLTDLEVSQA